MNAREKGFQGKNSSFFSWLGSSMATIVFEGPHIVLHNVHHTDVALKDFIEFSTKVREIFIAVR